VTKPQSTPEAIVWVALDIAKDRHEALIEAPGWKSRRSFACRTQSRNFVRSPISSAALAPQFELDSSQPATTIERLPTSCILKDFSWSSSPPWLWHAHEKPCNSWDKNDPKDAQVILHLLKARLTQHYHDPIVHNLNDHQELSKTHHHVSLEKTRTQHRLLTHYLPLYWPEIARYHSSSRSELLWNLLIEFPTPRSITRISRDESVRKAWNLVGRKVAKQRILTDIYLTAESSVGLPAEENSETVAILRFVLRQLLTLCQLRATIEERADDLLSRNEDYQRLQRIPGIGPISALTILAEARDLRRISHHR
jgi:hypothetical protein